MPVGKTTLSRIFNVFGKPIDGLGDLKNVELRSIHAPPPALNSNSTNSAKTASTKSCLTWSSEVKLYQVKRNATAYIKDFAVILLQETTNF